MKNRPVEKKLKRKIYPQIIIVSVVALVCIILAIFVKWIFIIPALILWWMNKRALKKINY